MKPKSNPTLMYEYLKNLEPQNATCADNVYCDRLIKELTKSRLYTSKEVKKSAIISSVSGLISIPFLTLIDPVSSILSFSLMVPAFMLLNARRKENSMLKKFGLNYKEFANLLESGKLQQIAYAGDIFCEHWNSVPSVYKNSTLSLSVDALLEKEEPSC